MNSEEITASEIEEFKKATKRARFWYFAWCATAGFYVGTIVAIIAVMT